MRAVIQRVKQASVTVNGRIISSIEQGLCVLVGIHVEDTEVDAEFIAKKIATLKLWPDAEGKPWKLNVQDAGHKVLSVSQFTLYAVTSKGSKPDFHLAMKSNDSFSLYNNFLESLRRQCGGDPTRVQDGEFGAMMDVALVNDGPITLGQQTEWAGPQHLNYKALKKVINAVEALAESAAQTGTSSAILGTTSAVAPVLLAASLDISHQAEFQALKTAFFFKLERELEKVEHSLQLLFATYFLFTPVQVNAFYLQKELEFKVRLRSLVDKKKVLRGRKSSQNMTAFINLKEAFSAFQQDLAKLQKFVEINREGFRKILKKWDKRAKSTTKELYLSRQIEIQPCFNNDVLTEFTDSATTNIAEIEAFMEHGDFVTPPDEADAPKKTVPVSISSPTFAQISESMNDLETDLINLLQTRGPQTVHTLDEIRDFMLRRKNAIHAEDHEFFSRIYLRVLSTASADAIQLLLSESIVDCNYIDDINNRTCVHEAAIAGRLDVLKLSVEVGGGNIESLDMYGRKPLHYASMYGKSDCLAYILAQPSSDNIDLLDLDGFTALTYSIIGGFVDCVKQCLDKGAAVDPATTMTASSLSLACEHGHAEIANLLLAKGASLVPNSDGLSPLHLAARAGHADLLALLIKNGGDVDLVDVFQGWTPVFYAASEGHAICVELLLKAGCSKTIKDETDWNPWTYALYHGHIEIAQLLEIQDDLSSSVLMDTPSNSETAAAAVVATVSNFAAKSFAQAVHEEVQEIQPMRPSALFTAEQTMDVEDLDMTELPSLSLPPPIIPFRIYGHNYLDNKYLVQVNLSSFSAEVSENSPITLFGSRQLSSLKLIISNKPDCEIPYTVILPLTDDSEPFAFFVSDLAEVSLQFDIYPTFGTKILGRSVVLASQIKNCARKSDGGQNETMVAPLFDSYLRVVGEIKFSLTVVNPFIHSRLQIGGKVETYWKSTMVVSSGQSKAHAETGIQSLITASSLVQEYINVVVQLTKDGIPVVYPSWFLRVDSSNNINSKTDQHIGVDVGVSALTLSEAVKIFQIQKDSAMGLSLLSELVGSTKMQTEGAAATGFRTLDLAKSVLESFLTLEEVLRNVPTTIGVSIELKYPTPSELEHSRLTGQVPSVNEFLDAVLKTVYDSSSNRSLIFSSSNPLVCATINWKQPNFGVFFKTHCGICEGKTTWKEADRRCGSIKEAIRFAKRSHFLGVICEATPLIQVPALIETIKQSGLMLASFGSKNQDNKNALVQEANGVDGIMANNVLKFSVNPSG
ncbi:phosphate system positive regulatory protein pho81 [Physocladia obscura]|uniref:D-aminoacyl-tRNA deacylase n=1 Tax=Physocladia obscura TaxID=109957 RepID=A0AAD5XGU5_9FUNG|nr:phosphate system positive regulatory protein pho81 [Physocladia obscura]